MMGLVTGRRRATSNASEFAREFQNKLFGLDFKRKISYIVGPVEVFQRTRGGKQADTHLSG